MIEIKGFYEIAKRFDNSRSTEPVTVEIRYKVLQWIHIVQLC